MSAIEQGQFSPDTRFQDMLSKAGLRKEELLQNPEWMNLMAQKAYEAGRNDYLSARAVNTIPPTDQVEEFTADDMHCLWANNKPVIELLKKSGIPAEYVEFEKEHGPAHGFINCRFSPDNKWIVDFQYLQFVPEELRVGLSPYLAFRYQTEQDVIRELETHKIPADKHKYWLEVFWDTKPENTKPFFEKPQYGWK
jgi:hypothetical protein